MNSLLDTKEFAKLKENILLCKDGKEEWKADFIEFTNDDCDNSDLSFFFDQLPFVRFIVDQSEEHVAFTTPEKKIYMNAPYVSFIGESKKLWESVYFHECLHQLWETFAVAEEIKKTLGEDKYDHAILNIASDCVINEFIMNNMRRKMPDNLVDAKFIKEKCGVDYDRAKDTQYTLYCKLFKKKEEIKKNMPDKYKEAGEEGDPGGQGGQGGQGGKSGGKSGGQGGKGGNGGKKDIKDMSGKEAAADAQKSANEAKDAANKAQAAADAAKEAAKNGGDQEAADKAQKAADAAKKAAEKAQKAADEAKAAADAGDDETARQKAQEARDAANKAKQKSQEAGQKTKEAAEGADGDAAEKAKEAGDEAEGQGGEHDPNEDGTPSGTKQIDHTGGPHELKEWLENDAKDDESNKMAKENVDKYKKRVDGIVGEYISGVKRCLKDIQQARDGQGYKTFAKAQGKSKWDIDFKNIVDAYIKQQIFNKKREMEPTYSRPNRRAGFVKFGQPIKKGVKPKEDKLNISMTFYIDKSGSMWGEDLENATKLAYGLSDAIEDKHKHEKKVIEKFEFKYYTFNEHIQPIKKHEKVESNGGNMSFEELLDVIKKNSINDMINVIITDAGFPINVSKTLKFVEEMTGLFVFVTNMNQCESDYREVEKRAKEHNFKYILADRHFDLHESADKL